VGEIIQEASIAAKIWGLISFIFGGLGIIGIVCLWINPIFLFLSLPLGFIAICFGILAYNVGKEKRFSFLGIILGAMTWIIFFIIGLGALSAGVPSCIL
jgi:hypothetical protein